MISLRSETPRKQEFAHYYGDWIWDEKLAGWIKSLLLFFDGIALAIPPARASQLIESEPVLAQPLAELGLLRNYWESMNIPYTKVFGRYGASLWRLAEILEGTYRETLSSSDLRELDRAIDNEEGGLLLKADIAAYNARVSRAAQLYGEVPSQVQVTTVSMVSWLLRDSATDVSIEPVIDDDNAAAYVAAIIGSRDSGRARIVTGDLAQIGIDLSAVPLDEVLDFRAKHGPEYRRYSNDVRKFVLELSLADEAGRHSAIIERHAELDDRAEQLRKIGRTAFARQTIGFGFGLAGAAWTLVHGDPWGASFAAGAVAAGLTRQDPEPIGASYTYILRAKTELRR
jgi:hypothetical protein